MVLRETSWAGVPIADAADYRRAGIALIDHAAALLQKGDTKLVCLPTGRGLARFANLLHWDPQRPVEYLDGNELFADQLVHAALHQVIGSLLPPGPSALLFEECVASAADLYLLGKLAAAGQEPDFLHDTLESFGFYYQTYAHRSSHLETLMKAMHAEPFVTMVRLVDFLFAFCRPLLSQPRFPYDELVEHERHFMYPLTHHFNLANWILHIRCRFPGDEFSPQPQLENVKDMLCRDENRFLAVIAKWRPTRPGREDTA